MPPSASAYAPAADRALSPLAADGPAVPAGMCFGDVPITETQTFPPAPAAQCWIYLTLNAEIALSLPENPTLRRLVQLPRVRVSVDGQWLWWALRRKYPGRPLAKLSGSDLVYTLAGHCAAAGRRLLLLGSADAINAQAVRRLMERHPGLQVAGFAPGPYEADGGEREAAVLEGALDAIRDFSPDYVVLGLGAEKEQRLCLHLAPLLDGQVAGLMCFGGAIDMVSGHVRRAPRWMQVCGIEGLYRVCQQPERLPRLIRVFRILPKLAALRY
jgi:N-acetylglucosaminyldiphosphoundecaprenol N-acetyl-beta-D-mannosaminyltransferase